MSEDCLYLNIWTPALRGYGADSMVASEKLPVMVWIYGGAYQCGGTFEKEFDGTHLAANGVVVVSVAYRLNAFGFMTHPLLHEEAVERGDGEPYANFGFLDQRAGIQWVKENIAKFGGDPENITVFGQSAGAASVLAQICSPMNHGLFQKAIMQSGAGLGYFNARQDTLEHAQANGIRLFEALGVSTLEQARAIPARTVLEAAESLSVPPDSGREDDWSMIVNWVPCVDGLFLPDQEERIVEGCKANNVDMLVGNTTNEFIASTEDGKPVHVGQLGNLTLIRKWTASGGTAPYYYHFDVAMPGDDAGAFHSSDLWFSFGSLAKCWRPFVGWHYDLARRMGLYWTNFAANGDPNGTDRDGTPLPVWDPCIGEECPAMHLCQEPGMRTDWLTETDRKAFGLWRHAVDV